jgi:hypothetical protein
MAAAPGAVLATLDWLDRVRPRRTLRGLWRPRPAAPRADHRGELAAQVARTLEREHAAGTALVARAPALEADLAQKRARHVRLTGELAAARDGTDRRRTVSLAMRAQRVGAEIERGERELAAARVAVEAGDERRRRTGVVHDAGHRERRAALLDREARLPAAAGDQRGGRRNYAALSGLAGLAGGEYESLAEPERRRARLVIDRELAQRDAWQRASTRRPQARHVSRRERQFARRELP